jgi:hypothetical protein
VPPLAFEALMAEIIDACLARVKKSPLRVTLLSRESETLVLEITVDANRRSGISRFDETPAGFSPPFRSGVVDGDGVTVGGTAEEIDGELWLELNCD